MISEAIFSFTTISALELNGRTSVFHLSFLWLDRTSKNTTKVPSSLNV
jgi:hypothetical protein